MIRWPPTQIFRAGVICIALALTTPSSPATAAPRCGDLLAEVGMSINGLTWRTCLPSRPDAQSASLDAVYDVTGDPRRVLAALRRRFHHADVVFMCCGWEPKSGLAGSIRTTDGYLIELRMASGETVEHDWARIGFTVTVQLFLEEP